MHFYLKLMEWVFNNFNYHIYIFTLLIYSTRKSLSCIMLFMIHLGKRFVHGVQFPSRSLGWCLVQQNAPLWNSTSSLTCSLCTTVVIYVSLWEKLHYISCNLVMGHLKEGLFYTSGYTILRKCTRCKMKHWMIKKRKKDGVSCSTSRWNRRKH